MRNQGSFISIKGENMESNILLDCAREFNRISDYNYLFTVGRAKKVTINVSLRCANKDFSHITGLDHLSDIKGLSKSSKKLSTFQNILSGKLTYNTISSSAFFQKPFVGTYNSSTKLEYTLIERISALKNIENILDNAYKGNFYKWSKSKSYINLPNGKTRHCTIDADYMLAVPSPYNPKEKIYFFMYEGKPCDSNTKQLYIFSAFPDCLDLSQGQEHPYTILTEEKENIKTKQISSLFVHPRYVPEGASSTPLQGGQNNINQFVATPLPSSGGTAVLAPPSPIFGQAVSSFIGKIKQFFEDKSTENKRLIKDLKKALSKRDTQLTEMNNEIADLKRECSELTDQLEKQKQLVPADAKPTKTFSQGLDEMLRKQYTNKSAASNQQTKKPTKPKL